MDQGGSNLKLSKGVLALVAATTIAGCSAGAAAPVAHKPTTPVEVAVAPTPEPQPEAQPENETQPDPDEELWMAACGRG